VVDVHYMYMNTTSLHIKIEPDIKKQAQKTADDLGLSLSAVMKALLKQFIRTKRLSVEAGASQRPEIPNARTRQVLKQAEEDMKAGRVLSFASTKDALEYLDKEIADEKRSTH
jgi:addiction module RelB/DinJ family antitoxin